MKNDKHPIKKEDIAKNPDPRIDQDYPGYPHAPSTEQFIVPETVNEEKTADTKQNNNDYDPKKRKETDAVTKETWEDSMNYHNGSADAFSRTEGSGDIDFDTLAEK